ncbi:MAG: NUDIX domain-containing protein [Chloroflexota bacterium]|nr:NUDIX domain-containing protein [Chloroflexota bacterium]MDE2921064.1 NUDIX domain-containing protein [Chloroflexota bacterium]
MPRAEVLVFPRKIFGAAFSLLPWGSVQAHISEIESSFGWLDRPDAESSEEFVQAIACAIVKDSADNVCVFRRVKDGRADLSGKLTLIVGGHIDNLDRCDDFGDSLLINLRREIIEEIGVAADEDIRPIGVIIDGSSVVASRHVAFLHELTADEVSPMATEEFARGSKLTGQFVSRIQLCSWINRFDPWSRLVIERYVCRGDVEAKARQTSFL